MGVIGHWRNNRLRAYRESCIVWHDIACEALDEVERLERWDAQLRTLASNMPPGQHKRTLLSILDMRDNGSEC